jgi:hypothetical protein
VTSHTGVRLGVACVLTTGLVALAAAVLVPLGVKAADARLTRAMPPVPAHSPLAVDSLVTAVVGRDPFRLGRRPATVAFNPTAGPETRTLPPSRPRPPLRLVGLVDGPRPQALIEGLPGTDRARALSQGESVAGVRLVGIGRGVARLAGMDTLWVLTLRRP